LIKYKFAIYIVSSKFYPGDLVRFNFWSSYLAPTAGPDENGLINWYELFPGDRGIVIYVCEKDSNVECDDTVTVVFSRVEKILKVHINQLKHDT